MMELSDEQLAAVDAGLVDLFVGAGAGSGKTRVLSARFVKAVLGIAPYGRLAVDGVATVTFTDRAAGELAERIRASLLAEGAPEVARRMGEAWISTIHGLCARLVRRNAFALGIDPRFGMATEVEAGEIVAEAFGETMRALLDGGDADAGLLLDAFGATGLADAVRAVHGDLRAMGRDTDAVRLQDPAAMQAALDDAAETLAASAATLRANCRMALATVRDNAELLDSAAGLARRGAADDAAALDALQRGCGKPRHLKSDEEHEAIIEEALAALDSVPLLAAQLAVRPYEEAFLRVLARFSETFAAMKRERGLLDFDDLQLLAARLLEDEPTIAEEYRGRFGMVMIDEFQDTDPLQLRIVERLSDRCLCTVGDDKQSIYSFRHADVRVFRRRRATATVSATLADNYRSHPELLDAFNGIFGSPALFGEDFMRLRAAGRRDDDRWPTGTPRAEAVFIARTSGDGVKEAVVEAQAIAERLARLHAAGVATGDMAVLLRTMSGTAEIFQRELEARGLPATIASGGTYFDTAEVAEVRALLRLADNVLDDEAALVVLAGRLTGLSDSALFALRERAGGGPLWGAVRAGDALSPDSGDQVALERTVEAVERLRARRGALSLGEALLDALERLDYDLTLFSLGAPGVRAWGNVLKLVRMADAFDEAALGDIGGFIEHLATRERHTVSEQQADVTGEDSTAVRVMSIHASKGLEFPVVAVAGISARRPNASRVLLGDDAEAPLLGMRLPVAADEAGGGCASVPTWGSQRIADAKAAADAAESKRLLYVACTRARWGLIVCAGSRFDKPAEGDALPEVLRRALGLGSAGALAESGERRVGEGCVAVSHVDPAELGEPAARPPASPPCREPERLAVPDERPQAAGWLPGRVSYSSLATYRSCGYRFYAQHVLGLRRVAGNIGAAASGGAEPGGVSATGGRDPLAFGSATHEVLQLAEGGVMPPEARVAAIVREHGLPDGSLAAVRGAAEAFLASPLAAEAYGAERVVRECPLVVPLEGSVLMGSVDLLAWRGASALIVDYKTGAGEIPAAEARERFGLQSRCYALAALSAGAEQVRVVFVELERGGRQTGFEYTRADEAGLRGELDGLVAAMGRGEYAPRERWDSRACGGCPALGSLCPVSVPRRGAA